jgi:hypothetical protein
LVTDIGNDLAYGQPPERLIEWVCWCLDRLAQCNARIIVTALPVESLERLSPWRYQYFRALLFPGRELTQAQALERARTVNEFLRAFCSEQGIALIEQPLEWFGLDPIHIQRRSRAIAYREILKPWIEPCLDDPLAARTGLRERWQMRLLAPQYRRLFGFEQYREQPAGLLPDGSTVSLY